MRSVFQKKLSFIILCYSSFLLLSCTKTQPVSALTYGGSQNFKNKLVYLAKITNHQPVKIACEGTSLTYGQNVPGVLPPINNAGQTRALYQYPSSLQLTLQTAGINANVINRGFPGDRTTEGIIRWRDSVSADVCIIEYGTNDAFNFGTYLSGPLTISAFTDNLNSIVKRRIDEGAWVIITSPPDINPPDTLLNGYKKAILAVAQKFDLPSFDVEKSVITSNADYFDGVHLTALAYQKWGVNIAPLLIINRFNTPLQ